MKKYIPFVVFIILINACGYTNEPAVSGSSKLTGQYRVSLDPIVPFLIKPDSHDGKWETLGKSVASVILSNIDIELSLYENGKGVIYIDGKLYGITITMGTERVEKQKHFSYKLEHDSVLCIKTSGMNTYKPWAVMRKPNNTYDHCQMQLLENGKEQIYFSLDKIAE